MVGTLWHNHNGICVCTKHEDGFYTFVYLDDPTYASCVHKSRLHIAYTQLTQPQEET